MRIRLITLIIIILPLFVKAQRFNPNPPRLDPPQFDLWPMQDKKPKVPQLETVKPIYKNRIENAQAKLTREEQKLIKLAEKRWEKEADLKAKQEKLKNLESTPKNNNDPDHQKNIEKYKRQIVKSQDELDKAKIEVELSTKKVEELEKVIEEAKFTRQGY